MHSTIASTSMSVPTIAISYSHKFEGVLAGVIGRPEYIVDIRDFSSQQLSKELCWVVDCAWENRELLAKELAENIETVKKKALANAELTKELLDSL